MAHTWPRFSDGDVEIQLNTTDNKFILHSYVLALHSSWFKASLSERWTQSGSASLLGGNTPSGKQRVVYQLRFEKDSAMGLLMRRTTDDTASSADGEMFGPSTTPTQTNPSAEDLLVQQGRLETIIAHQQLLSTFYHIHAPFSHTSFDEARKAIIALQTEADKYGCVHIVKRDIESHLCLYRDHVLQQCEQEPVEMLELAITIKSEWVFMEAATNLLGRSNRYFENARPKLMELHVDDLFERKRNEFVSMLRDCDLDLFAIPAVVGRGQEHLHAVNFFRNWVSEQRRLQYGSELGPGYANLYRCIDAERTSTSEADCRKKQMAWFKAHSPAELPPINKSNSATDRADKMSACLREVFEEAGEIVAPLIEDLTRRKLINKDDHRTLRCMSIDDEEIPWAGQV